MDFLTGIFAQEEDDILFKDNKLQDDDLILGDVTDDVQGDAIYNEGFVNTNSTLGTVHGGSIFRKGKGDAAATYMETLSYNQVTTFLRDNDEFNQVRMRNNGEFEKFEEEDDEEEEDFYQQKQIGLTPDYHQQRGHSIFMDYERSNVISSLFPNTIHPDHLTPNSKRNFLEKEVKFKIVDVDIIDNVAITEHGESFNIDKCNYQNRSNVLWREQSESSIPMRAIKAFESKLFYIATDKTKVNEDVWNKFVALVEHFFKVEKVDVVDRPSHYFTSIFFENKWKLNKMEVQKWIIELWKMHMTTFSSSALLRFTLFKSVKMYPHDEDIGELGRKRCMNCNKHGEECLCDGFFTNDITRCKITVKRRSVDIFERRGNGIQKALHTSINNMMKNNNEDKVISKIRKIMMDNKNSRVMYFLLNMVTRKIDLGDNDTSSDTSDISLLEEFNQCTKTWLQTQPQSTRTDFKFKSYFEIYLKPIPSESIGKKLFLQRSPDIILEKSWQNVTRMLKIIMKKKVAKKKTQVAKKKTQVAKKVTKKFVLDEKELVVFGKKHFGKKHIGEKPNCIYPLRNDKLSFDSHDHVDNINLPFEVEPKWYTNLKNIRKALEDHKSFKSFVEDSDFEDFSIDFYDCDENKKMDKKMHKKMKERVEGIISYLENYIITLDKIWLMIQERDDLNWGHHLYFSTKDQTVRDCLYYHWYNPMLIKGNHNLVYIDDSVFKDKWDQYEEYMKINCFSSKLVNETRFLKKSMNQIKLFVEMLREKYQEQQRQKGQEHLSLYASINDDHDIENVLDNVMDKFDDEYAEVII